MDDLVLQKLIALDWALTKMEAMDRLREVIEQLDAEIIAENETKFKASHCFHWSHRPIVIITMAT